MVVAGVLSFLMEKEEELDQGDKSFFKRGVADKDCLAEMTILSNTYHNSTCCQEGLKTADPLPTHPNSCVLEVPVLYWGRKREILLCFSSHIYEQTTNTTNLDN